MPRMQSVSYTENVECVDIDQLSIQPNAAFVRPNGSSIAIDIEWLPMNFGGQRAYFVCPVCNRRCRKLYDLACYKCRGLKHRTKSLSPSDRATRKAVLHRRRYGQEHGGLNEPFPPKPRHMKWTTYYKALVIAQKLEREAITKFKFPDSMK